MNSGVPASLPWPTHCFLPGLPPSTVGGMARPAWTPGPLSTFWGWVTPFLPLTQRHSRARKGYSREWSWLGALPLCHTHLAWAGMACLPASCCSCPPRTGPGTGQEGKAKRVWKGQSPIRKVQREAFSSWDEGANPSWSTGVLSFPLPSVSSSLKWEENTSYLLGRLMR